MHDVPLDSMATWPLVERSPVSGKFTSGEHSWKVLDPTLQVFNYDSEKKYTLRGLLGAAETTICKGRNKIAA